MVQYTREQIEETLRGKGYKYFTSDKRYDVNIVGIRNSKSWSTKNLMIHLQSRIKILMVIDLQRVQSDNGPGSHWEKNLLNKDGGDLKPGQ